MRIGRLSAIHKKLQSPQSNISQATHCSPCLADPHAPRIPIRSISPYVFRGSAIQSASSKNLTLILTRPATGSANDAPTSHAHSTDLRHSPANQAPASPDISRTCVTIQQIKRQPIPANTTCLRGGGGGTSGAYGHGCVCIGMRTPSGVCARPWQHPFIGHVSDGNSADGLRGSTLQPNSHKFQRPTPGGHGYGVASRRGDGAAVGACIQARLKAGACGADPRGTLGLRTLGVCTWLVQILVPLLLGVVAAACICDPDRQAATLAQARARVRWPLSRAPCLPEWFVKTIFLKNASEGVCQNNPRCIWDFSLCAHEANNLG